MILRVFMSEYLNLRPQMLQPPPTHERLQRSASELVRFNLIFGIFCSVNHGAQ
jgi:hypothetical protein